MLLLRFSWVRTSSIPRSQIQHHPSFIIWFKCCFIQYIFLGPLSQISALQTSVVVHLAISLSLMHSPLSTFIPVLSMHMTLVQALQREQPLAYILILSESI